jgi:hypothetical protein
MTENTGNDPFERLYSQPLFGGFKRASGTHAVSGIESLSTGGSSSFEPHGEQKKLADDSHSARNLSKKIDRLDKKIEVRTPVEGEAQTPATAQPQPQNASVGLPQPQPVHQGQTMPQTRVPASPPVTTRIIKRMPPLIVSGSGGEEGPQVPASLAQPYKPSRVPRMPVFGNLSGQFHMATPFMPSSRSSGTDEEEPETPGTERF